MNMKIKFRCALLCVLLFNVNIRLVWAQDKQNYTNGYNDPAQEFLHQFYFQYINGEEDSTFNDATKYFTPWLFKSVLIDAMCIRAGFSSNNLEIIPVVKDKSYNVCIAGEEYTYCARYTLIKKDNRYLIDHVECFEEGDPQPELYGGKSSEEYTTSELTEYISGSYIFDDAKNCKLILDIDKQGNYQFNLNGNDRDSGQIEISIGENTALEPYIKFGEFHAIYFDYGLGFFYSFPECDGQIEMKKVKEQDE